MGGYGPLQPTAEFPPIIKGLLGHLDRQGFGIRVFLRLRVWGFVFRVQGSPRVNIGNIGASIITNTILVVPCYNYSIMGPKTLLKIIKAQ